MEVTVSEMSSIDASEYHAFVRRRSFSGSGMRALDSLVRSRGRFGSWPMRVIEPL